MTRRTPRLRAATWAVALLVVTGALTFAFTSGGSETSPGTDELSPLSPGGPGLVLGGLPVAILFVVVFLVSRWAVGRAYRQGSDRRSG